MSHTSFRNDPTTTKEILIPGNVNTDVVFANTVYSSGYIYGNIAFASGAAQASIPSVVNADIQGNLTASAGNVSALFFIGNGSQLTGVNVSLPSTITADTRGNVIGNFANVNNVSAVFGNVSNVLFNNGNVSAAGGNGFFFGNGTFLKFSTITAGNLISNFANISNVVINSSGINANAGVISANSFRGDGSQLSGVLTTTTGTIIADIFGNITAQGDITTVGSLSAGSLSGDGSGITNIPFSSLQAGGVYRDIYGNITGTTGNFTGNVICSTVNSANVFSGNITGVLNAAYANLESSPYNLNATTTGLFLRSGTSTMALIRTDGCAIVSNGVAYRFGTNDYDKGMLTNGSDGQYATNTSAGDLIVHNTKVPGRVCMASSYGIPEITCKLGNVGIRTADPVYKLDVRGEGRFSSGITTGNVVNIESTMNIPSINMLMCVRDSNASNNAVFRVEATGNVYADGVYSSSGADFAEMFEWEDQNPLREDRRGITVVLGNSGYIRASVITDPGEDVFGAVSSTPTVVGGNAERWVYKYQTDEFGGIVKENVLVDGEIVSVPILNPNYDPNLTYIPRINRPEWAPVGVIGRVLIRRGQLINPRWRFIKTIGDLNEYLIR